MNKLITLSALVLLGLSIGCGPEIAGPPTAEEEKAVQAPVEDMMKQMQNMNTKNMTEAPQFGKKPEDAPAASE